jgi:hypothetical protein
MKATIYDSTSLRALGPLEVAAYLRSTGWRQVDRLGDRGVVWTFTASNGDGFEILLPLNRDLADFLPRMADVISVLERAERRSQLEIVRDLIAAPADVIRIRAQQPESRDGTIPLDDGVELVQRAREMLLAAACAAVQPKAFFPPRKPVEAVAYMEKVRLGQTERGSYVVTLLSRVPPSLEPTKSGQTHLDVEDPFERRVTQTLARALMAIRKASQDSATTGDFASFQNAIQAGVSANLCDALAAMAGGSAAAEDLEVNFTWSRLRPLETNEPRRILLSADAIPTIEEAGRIFRETSPRQDFELLGFVIGLQRTDPEQPGRVTISGFVDETARRVTLELTGKDYELAITAHRDRRPIRCLGELVKSGHQFELQNPHHLEFVVDE